MVLFLFSLEAGRQLHWSPLVCIAMHHEAHEIQHIESSVGMGCKEGQEKDKQSIPKVYGINVTQTPQVEPIGQYKSYNALLKQRRKEACPVKP